MWANNRDTCPRHWLNPAAISYDFFYKEVVPIAVKVAKVNCCISFRFVWKNRIFACFVGICVPDLERQENNCFVIKANVCVEFARENFFFERTTIGCPRPKQLGF